MNRFQSICAVGAGILILAALPLLLGQTKVPAVATQPDSFYPAVMEMVCPPGTDQVACQRQLQTMIARFRMQGTLAFLRQTREFVEQSDKILPQFRASVEALAPAVEVKVIPGTFVIEVRVACSSDPNVSVAITNALARILDTNIRLESVVRTTSQLGMCARSIEDARITLQKAQQPLEAFIRLHDLDVPLPPSANADAIRDRAVALRELSTKEFEVTAARETLLRVQRKYLELQFGEITPFFQMIQEAKASN